jgi:hypothetical protein
MVEMRRGDGTGGLDDKVHVFKAKYEKYLTFGICRAM